MRIYVKMFQTQDPSNLKIGLIQNCRDLSKGFK